MYTHALSPTAPDTVCLKPAHLVAHLVRKSLTLDPAVLLQAEGRDESIVFGILLQQGHAIASLFGVCAELVFGFPSR